MRVVLKTCSGTNAKLPVLRTFNFQGQRRELQHQPAIHVDKKFPLNVQKLYSSKALCEFHHREPGLPKIDAVHVRRHCRIGREEAEP